MLRKWMPPGRDDVEPLALFRTLAVHEELMSRMLAARRGILGHGRITAREREIVIHRTCALAGAEYEWGVHAAAFAAGVGLTDAQLAATVHGGRRRPGVVATRTALIIALCDELHDTCDGLRRASGPPRRRRTPADHLLELIIDRRLVPPAVRRHQRRPVPLEPWAARFPTA